MTDAEKAEPLDRPTIDIDERASPQQYAGESDLNKPHYPVWQWVLSLVSLYLGALLYGMSCECDIR